MLQLSSSTIMYVGNFYMFKQFSQHGLMEKFYEVFPVLISEDQKRIDRAEKEIEEFIPSWLEKRGVKVDVGGNSI